MTERSLRMWVAGGVAALALGTASLACHAQVPLLAAVDLGIHELGHLVFSVAPEPVALAAGSVMQVAVPLGLAAYFGLLRREGWAAAILLAWAGTSARNVAVYIADAPYQRLALLGGEGVLHDWATLLAGKPMFYADDIAGVVDALGLLTVAAAVGLCVYGLWGEGASVRRERELAARRETLPRREKRDPVGM